MFLLSLPQSGARRAAIEPHISKHASNVTLVKPFDGRRPRRRAAEVALSGNASLVHSLTSSDQDKRYCVYDVKG